MKERLNFSPQPFQSRSPVLLALWPLNLLFLVLLLGSLWYWWQLRSQNQNAHQNIASVQDQQQDVADMQAEMIRRLESVDMKSYRKQVNQFHQIQATVQTHWGRLLDNLGLLLPEDIRILHLAPAYRSNDDFGVAIELTAEARNKQAQLQFIETLQKEEAFENILFHSEQYVLQSSVALEFEISFSFNDGGAP